MKRPIFTQADLQAIHEARQREQAETEVSGMDVIERLESECTGGYACFAVEHIEGCHTGEGDPIAVRGLYVAGLRDQLRGAVDLIRELVDAGTVAQRPTAEYEEHERWWLVEVLGDAREAFRDEAAARDYVEEAAADRVIEVVPADQLAGAVEALDRVHALVTTPSVEDYEALLGAIFDVVTEWRNASRGGQ